MFTGLIEAVCTVKSVQQTASGGLLIVNLGKLAEGCKDGDSIAINGACLTIVALEGDIASFDLSGETLARSNLGKLQTSSKVNVERAMKADGRFGGHIVQGHVDGTARIEASDKLGEFANIRFSTDRRLLEQLIVKGYVAVDGISLTVTDMDDRGFSVAVIPETLQRTTLGAARAGDMVNIETDIVVKTVRKQLEGILPEKEALTVERLRQLGF